MDKFDRVFTKIADRIALYWSGTLIWVMMFYVVGHVFARYVLGTGGLVGTYAYVGALLPPTIYMAMAFGFYKGAYVSIDILSKKLTGKALWWLQLFYLLLLFIFFACFLTLGTVLDTITAIQRTWMVGEPGYYIVGWPWKVTMIIGMVMLSIRLLLDLIRTIRTGEVIPKNR
jgi:TRAP-type C4-dicarboxylate transport system permease small subunit